VNVNTIANIATNNINFLNFFYLLKRADLGFTRHSFTGDFSRQRLNLTCFYFS